MILDCTFRDGGYYTNWQFDDQIVEEYLSLCDSLKHVEIGYVNQGKNPFNDVSPELVDRFRNSLPNTKLYLMSDRPCLTSAEEIQKKYQDLDCDCVRVAIDHDLVDEKCRFIFEKLKEMNFETSINISKFYLLRDFEKTVQMLESWPVDYIYLADSFGSIYPEQLEEYLKVCRKLTSKKIGFHGHDSMGLAFYNTTKASAEADLVDTTMAGIGKGSGNAATEEVMDMLLGDCPKDIIQVSQKFRQMKSKLRWGRNFLYFRAALYQVNPTYVQQMQRSGMSEQQILEIIPMLANQIAYDKNVLSNQVEKFLS